MITLSTLVIVYYIYLNYKTYKLDKSFDIFKLSIYEFLIYCLITLCTGGALVCFIIIFIIKYLP